jgi:RNA-binding protein
LYSADENSIRYENHSTFIEKSILMPQAITLTSRQMRHLRGLAHTLKPVLQIGDKGLSESVLTELDLVLETHELIKISIASKDREERKTLTEALCQASGAGLIQMIGRTSIVYRKAKEAVIKLPKPLK